eukprot:g46028.t1
MHAHLHQLKYNGGEFDTMLSANTVSDLDVRHKVQATFALGGRLRNTCDDGNYVAEACGLLCTLWATTVDNHYKCYVDNRASLHTLNKREDRTLLY